MIFDDADTSAAKLAWVNGWRKLPHIDREVQRLYDYPQQFAEDIYDRIEQRAQTARFKCRGMRRFKNRAPVYRVRGRP